VARRTPRKIAAPRKVSSRWRRDSRYVLYRGDCLKLLKKLPAQSVKLIVTSPPYCIGKSYEKNRKAEKFLPQLKKIMPELYRVLRVGGSICWQIGYHVDKRVVTPLDYFVYQLTSEFKTMRLRNRIVWTFGHGLHADDRFSGRHETILWFTKGKRYRFFLDAVRELQKYPGKRHYKGDNKGKLSGNPKGKNPSDVWQIPNVKANHVEKTVHPCQFPIALAQRLIAALTRRGELVLDPFSGVGSTAAAAATLGRDFVGAEVSARYHKIALKRLTEAIRGRLVYRPSGRPIYKPKSGTPLTTVPPNWKMFSLGRSGENGANGHRASHAWQRPKRKRSAAR
jgi:adenine-specific DNA-methyltransferase